MTQSWTPDTTDPPNAFTRLLEAILARAERQLDRYIRRRLPTTRQRACQAEKGQKTRGR